MGHKASTICLNLDLSCAACCASPQVRFISFSSAVTVRRQVFLGWPCFLFPGGVNRRAILGMRSWSILRTCPSHLNRRRLISSTTLLHFLHKCGYFLRPEDSTEFPEASIMEGFNFFHVVRCYSPALRAVQQHRFYVTVVESDLCS